MQKTIHFTKKNSETPLECLERWKKENPAYLNIKMTYAGRLDPMAEGEMLFLVGEECKNKDKYLLLKKEYELDILFGFQTDSFDILGLVEEKTQPENLNNYDLARHKINIDLFLKKIQKRFLQEYPAFSSKTINGKKLFQLKKDGLLDEKNLPEKEVEIYSAEKIKDYFISEQEFKNDIFKRVMLVKGDFRQEKVLENWTKILKDYKDINFLVSKIKINCSSGTYMRSLANEAGNFVNLPALAYKIKRTKMG